MLRSNAAPGLTLAQMTMLEVTFVKILPLRQMLCDDQGIVEKESVDPMHAVEVLGVELSKIAFEFQATVRNISNELESRVSKSQLESKLKFKS